VKTAEECIELLEELDVAED
jgi:hypothetical protein